jgi:hypothetical protein
MNFDSVYEGSRNGKRYSVTASLIGVFVERLPVIIPEYFAWDKNKVPSESAITWISKSVIQIDYTETAQTIAQAMGPDNLRDLGDLVYLEFQIDGSGGAVPVNSVTSQTYFGMAPYPVDSSYYRNPGPDSAGFIDDATIYSGYPADPPSTADLQYYGRAFFENHSRYKAPGNATPWEVSGGVGPARAEGNVCMMAFNFINGRVWFGYNGVWDMTLHGPATGTDPTDLDYADMGPAGSDIIIPYTIGSKGRGNLNFDAAYFPVFTFFPSYALDSQATVTIFGSDEAPFNYPVPAGYNGT